MKKDKNEIKQYTLDEQKVYLSMLMSDPSAFVRCQNIIKPEYFHEKLKASVRFIIEFTESNSTLPLIEQVNTNKDESAKIQKFEGIAVQHSEWLMKEVEQFCRHRAVELVSLESVDLISAGRYAEYEQKLKDALTISLQTDLGMDYWDDPEARLKGLLDRSNVVSTGWKALDNKLYGGFTKGALNIFCGGSGSGKSLFLQNLALNWSFMGLDVVYFSMELSEPLVSSRLDCMVSDMGTKDLFKRITDASMKIKMTQRHRKAGRITVKKMPEAGTTTNVLRAYLKEYEIQMGKKPDAIIVDYLDIMYPNNAKIDPTNAFAKDKYVSEELRGLYGEMDVIGASASQLNRGSIEANGTFDHSHIAGGISKINTADNVFAIYTNAAMKERGEYQLNLLKTRSSSSVGQNISLSYNNVTMVIGDMDEDEEIVAPMTQTQLQQTLKASLVPKKMSLGTIASATTTTIKKKENINEDGEYVDELVSQEVPPWEDTPPPKQPEAPSDTRTKMMNMLNRVQKR